MLPVQTVMIRYMVLVYRWGSGWLGAAGAREGFVGGYVCRADALAGGLSLPESGCEKAPPTVSRRGLLEVNAIRLCFLLQCWSYLAALQAH